MYFEAPCSTFLKVHRFNVLLRYVAPKRDRGKWQKTGEPVLVSPCIPRQLPPPRFPLDGGVGTHRTLQGQTSTPRVENDFAGTTFATLHWKATQRATLLVGKGCGRNLITKAWRGWEGRNRGGDPPLQLSGSPPAAELTSCTAAAGSFSVTRRPCNVNNL